jgi:hypothetical protein
LTVENVTQYPVHNLDLTVQVFEKSEEVLDRMGQISDLTEVEFDPPDFPSDFGLKLRGTDGQSNVLRPGDHSLQFGGYWKTFCPKVSAGLPFSIAIAAENNRDHQAPKRLHVLGSYDAILTEGEPTKFVTFEKW